MGENCFVSGIERNILDISYNLINTICLSEARNNSDTNSSSYFPSSSLTYYPLKENKMKPVSFEIPLLLLLFFPNEFSRGLKSKQRIYLAILVVKIDICSDAVLKHVFSLLLSNC